MTTKICPVCHSPIPAHAPGGLCPACLLRDAEEPPESGRPVPPLEEVAAAFPSLEVLEKIGHGGMGVVFKARQPALDRIVALKILLPELSRDPAFAERFAREARVLGKLSHPNIVTVFEHGERGGFFYLLMEYVDGVNLRQAMRAGRFTPEQALALVPGICDALQAAHAQGVWHRDIKPENLLLDAAGGVKIADFGIARIVGDPLRDFTLTRTGNTLGSIAYMAPEQHEKPHQVDHRADIYSLGVVIYEMLTGELPLGRFPAPSRRAEVNARIDEIVLRTLEKERELRQQSAAEVKTEVAGAATTRKTPVAGKPAGRANPFLWAAGLMAAGICLHLMGMSLALEHKGTSILLSIVGRLAVVAGVAIAAFGTYQWKPTKWGACLGMIVSLAVIVLIGGGLLNGIMTLVLMIATVVFGALGFQRMKPSEGKTPAPRRPISSRVLLLSGLALLTLTASALFWISYTEKGLARLTYEESTKQLKLQAVNQLGSWEVALLTMREPRRNYTLGPAIEQTIPKPAQGVACMFDFESGLLFNPPDALGELLGRGDTSFAAPVGSYDRVHFTGSRFDWLLAQGIDAVATMPDCDSIRLFRSMAYPMTGSFDDITADEVEERVREGLRRAEGSGALLDSFTKREFIQLPAPASAPFAFISARNHFGDALIGVMQIAGKQTAPEGVKIRYRLIKRLPDTYPGDNSGVEPITPSSKESGRDWPLDAESLEKLSRVGETEAWSPWGGYIKNGDAQLMRGDLTGALQNYRSSAACFDKKEHRNHRLPQIAESHTKCGDVLSLQGDLPNALLSYRAAVAAHDHEEIVKNDPLNPENATLKDELIALHVKVGDILNRQGDRTAALQSYREGVAVAEQLAKGWENEYPLQPEEVAPFEPDALTRLVSGQPNPDDHDRNRQLMWLINRAGAAKDASFRYLLDRPDLRQDHEVDLALASYDYSVNGNTKALDYILTKLAAEQVGSDASEVVALFFVDEWKRTTDAVQSHFAATDGAGGDCKNSFWATRQFLFPRNYLVFRGKAGEGAPLPEKPRAQENEPPVER